MPGGQVSLAFSGKIRTGHINGEVNGGGRTGSNGFGQIRTDERLER